MNKTNFDRYLDEQLKDPAFAARFECAGVAYTPAVKTDCILSCSLLKLC